MNVLGLISQLIGIETLRLTGEMHDLLDWKFYKYFSLILGELLR